MHRYGNIEYIHRLTIKSVGDLIKKAEEENERDKIYLWYVSLFPHMKKPTTFERFYNTYKTKTSVSKKIDTRSEEEIMNEILEIEKQFKK